jgi:hypothetical protein
MLTWLSSCRLAIVYLGVLIGSQDQSSKDTIVSYTVLAVSAVVTLGAMWYIYWVRIISRVHLLAHGTDALLLCPENEPG